MYLKPRVCTFVSNLTLRHTLSHFLYGQGNLRSIGLASLWRETTRRDPLGHDFDFPATDTFLISFRLFARIERWRNKRRSRGNIIRSLLVLLKGVPSSRRSPIPASMKRTTAARQSNGTPFAQGRSIDVEIGCGFLMSVTFMESEIVYPDAVMGFGYTSSERRHVERTSLFRGGRKWKIREWEENECSDPFNLSCFFFFSVASS